MSLLRYDDEDDDEGGDESGSKEETPLKAYSKLNNFNQRPYTAYGGLTKNTHEKMISPFQLRHHFSHKSIYSSKYTNSLIGRRTPRKDFQNDTNGRSKSTINFYRSYTSRSFSKTPTSNANVGQNVDVEEDESNIKEI
jgi:hypothetical protein